MVDLRNLKLLTIEEIKRRLASLTGEYYKRRDGQITRYDIANWMGIGVREVRRHQKGGEPITESMQIVYSQTFALIDAGMLVIEKGPYGKKTLVRVSAPPVEPMKKKLRPWIDFENNLSLKFD